VIGAEALLFWIPKPSASASLKPDKKKAKKTGAATYEAKKHG